MAWKGKVANILQEVDLPLISDSVCAKTNNERYFKPVRNLKIQLQKFFKYFFQNFFNANDWI